MRILQIDKKAKEAILRLKLYAENHKVDLETMKKMVNRIVSPVGDNLNYVCYLHDGYRIVFSIEEHPSGWYRHISISVENNTLPSISSTELIMKEFGFQGAVENCADIWIEENISVAGVGNDIIAVNLIWRIYKERLIY